MQQKRNPINQNNAYCPKSSNLIQPFINISKASTPVRTRIVAQTPQMNSTPINMNKIIGNIHKSPSNKENCMVNFHRIEAGVKTYTNPAQLQSRINLSPILALNRKLNEGPQNLNKKSFTPQPYKAIEQYQGFNNDDFNQFSKNYNTLTINDSKNSSHFGSTTNYVNMKSSNCFKALIDTKAKSPNRFQNSNSKMMQKRESGSGLKESLSSNHLFKNFGRDSKAKLAQSRSFDNLKSFSSNKLENSEIKCMNNDGKKAKYRVINSQEQRDDGDHGHLYYCSKCTIPLVQQGFIVQQIGKEPVKVEYEQKQTRRFNDYSFKIENKRKNVQNLLGQIQFKENNELKHVNRYYDSLIDYLQKQRFMDKKIIEDYFQHKKAEPIALIQKLNSCSEAIKQLNNNNKTTVKNNQIEQILQINENAICNPDNIQLCEYRVDDLTNKFMRHFEQYLRIPFRGNNNQQETNRNTKNNDQIINRNHAMRFSFQKIISDIHKNKTKMDQINPLREVEEQYEIDAIQPEKQQHTAFRDLFPEEEQIDRTNNNSIHSPTFKHI